MDLRRSHADKLPEKITYRTFNKKRLSREDNAEKEQVFGGIGSPSLEKNEANEQSKNCCFGVR
jgi:hypothetical protein